MNLAAKIVDAYKDYFYYPVVLKFWELIVIPWKKLEKSKWGIATPFALPMWGESKYTWKDWKRDTKNARPIRYFIFWTLPIKIRQSFPIRIYHTFFSWLQGRFIYKQHLLDLRDKANNYNYGWIEHDVALVFAIFKCVERFVLEIGREETEIKVSDPEKVYVHKANLILDFYLETSRGEYGSPGDIEWAKKLGDIFNAYYYWKFERPLIDAKFGENEEYLFQKDNEHLEKILKYRQWMWT